MIQRHEYAAITSRSNAYVQTKVARQAIRHLKERMHEFRDDFLALQRINHFKGRATPWSSRNTTRYSV
jgi:hypothetical protein